MSEVEIRITDVSIFYDKKEIIVMD